MIKENNLHDICANYICLSSGSSSFHISMVLHLYVPRSERLAIQEPCCSVMHRLVSDVALPWDCIDARAGEV